MGIGCSCCKLFEEEEEEEEEEEITNRPVQNYISQPLPSIIVQEVFGRSELVEKNNSTAPASVAKHLIDINTASRRKLLRLQGVGPAIAERIILNRPFYRKEELVAVRGIGEKKLGGFEHQLAPFNSRKAAALSNAIETTSIIRDDQGNNIVHLATWNVRHLSRHKPLEQLKQIAQVIEQFDLIALQEVRDHRVLKIMKCLLAKDWNFTASTLVGRGARNKDQSNVHQEIYAYFYRKSRIRLRGNPSLVLDPQDRFVREPFLAHFVIPSVEFDFVLVNIHVVFGKRIDRVDELQQLEQLIDTIDQHVVTAQVIVMGDFNMPPAEYTLKDRFPLIRPPMSTTIYSNLYDNIWLPTLGSSCSVEKCGVYRIDHKYFPKTKQFNYTTDSAKKARQKCNQVLSDHLPVFVTLRLTKQQPLLISRTESIRLSHIEHVVTTRCS